MNEILFRGFHPCEDDDKTVYVDGTAFKGRWIEGIPINKNRYMIVNYFGREELKDEDFMFLKCIIRKVIPSTVKQHTGISEIDRLVAENAKLREVVGLAIKDLQLCDICKYCTNQNTNEDCDCECGNCNNECYCYKCTHGTNWKWQHADELKNMEKLDLTDWVEVDGYVGVKK